jgi:hypothetical protein
MAPASTAGWSGFYGSRSTLARARVTSASLRCGVMGAVAAISRRPRTKSSRKMASDGAEAP